MEQNLEHLTQILYKLCIKVNGRFTKNFQVKFMDLLLNHLEYLQRKTILLGIVQETEFIHLFHVVDFNWDISIQYFLFYKIWLLFCSNVLNM